MKAIVHERYGPPEVLQLREVEKPAPKNNEVLIRVFATTVTATDCMMRKGEPLWSRIILGMRKPRKKILGIELAGEVEAVGKDVQRLRPGDQVFGAAMARMSCWAEYVCLPEKAGLAVKPVNMTFEEAAAFPDGALTALTFLSDIGKIQCGRRVLINGASGSVGSFAVQLAKCFGAYVAGVCSNSNVDMVKSLGADRVFDYTKEDFTQSGETYDIVFDAVNKTSFSHCKALLKSGGVFLPVLALDVATWSQIVGTMIASDRKVKTGMSRINPERLKFLRELAEKGAIKSVIDKVYRMEQIVEAHRHVDTGHKKGNVVVIIE